MTHSENKLFRFCTKHLRLLPKKLKVIRSAEGSKGASVLAETSLGAPSGRFNVKVKSVGQEMWRWHEAMVAPDDGSVKSDVTELCSCCIACGFLCWKEKAKSWARCLLPGSGNSVTRKHPDQLLCRPRPQKNGGVTSLKIVFGEPPGALGYKFCSGALGVGGVSSN